MENKKSKKILFLGIAVSVVVVAVIVVIIILNNGKEKKNNDDINNNIDTDIDQNLFFEEELDPEEMELLNRQRTQEIRSMRK